MAPGSAAKHSCPALRPKLRRPSADFLLAPLTAWGRTAETSSAYRKHGRKEAGQEKGPASHCVEKQGRRGRVSGVGCRVSGNMLFVGSLCKLSASSAFSDTRYPIPALHGSRVVELADQQAEVGAVYRAVEVEVNGGIVAAADNAAQGIERADEGAEVR